MTTLAFDTLRAAKLLQQAGFDESQAEAVVTTVGDALTENVATKADLSQVEVALKTELGELRTELKTDVAAVRAELGELRTELKTDVAAVRAELGELRTELKTDVAAVRAEFKTDLGGLEARLYRQLWVMAAGIVGLTVSLTVALVKLVL